MAATEAHCHIREISHTGYDMARHRTPQCDANQAGNIDIRTCPAMPGMHWSRRMRYIPIPDRSISSLRRTAKDVAQSQGTDCFC